MSLPPIPSRRDVVTGRLAGPSPAEAHVSSLVVHAYPERQDSVRAALLAMAGVEIPAEGAGKLVVTLETASEDEIVSRLHEITFLDGVLSAALVYHHHEPLPDQE